jgi:hypothetical protein
MTQSNAEKCQNMINVLTEFACGKEFSGQMDIARELFAVATGKVTDEDSFYENRLSLFQNFFVFDFRLSEKFSGSTLFELFLLRLQAEKSRRDDVLDYEYFRSMRRSLFKVEKIIDESTIVVRDLFARSSLMVLALPEFTFNGFEIDGIFEGRVVSFKGHNFFSGAFVFHPHEVRDIVDKRRHDLLAALAEQKRLAESSDKRKALDILNINKSLSKLSQEVGGASLVMALGNSHEVSPFVPETPFFDASALIDALSYSELKCCRFKHINPQKLYSPDNSDVNALNHPRAAGVSVANA